MKLMQYKRHMHNLESLADQVIKNERLSENETDPEMVENYQWYANTHRYEIRGYIIAIGAFAGDKARDKFDEYIIDYMRQKKVEETTA